MNSTVKSTANKNFRIAITPVNVTHAFAIYSEIRFYPDLPAVIGRAGEPLQLPDIVNLLSTPIAR